MKNKKFNTFGTMFYWPQTSLLSEMMPSCVIVPRHLFLVK